jgi:hypothetical protein
MDKMAASKESGEEIPDLRIWSLLVIVIEPLVLK